MFGLKEHRLRRDILLLGKSLRALLRQRIRESLSDRRMWYRFRHIRFKSWDDPLDRFWGQVHRFVFLESRLDNDLRVLPGRDNREVAPYASSISSLSKWLLTKLGLHWSHPSGETRALFQIICHLCIFILFQQIRRVDKIFVVLLPHRLLLQLIEREPRCLGTLGASFWNTSALAAKFRFG